MDNAVFHAQIRHHRLDVALRGSPQGFVVDRITDQRNPAHQRKGVVFVSRHVVRGDSATAHDGVHVVQLTVDELLNLVVPRRADGGEGGPRLFRRRYHSHAFGAHAVPRLDHQAPFHFVEHRERVSLRRHLRESRSARPRAERALHRKLVPEAMRHGIAGSGQVELVARQSGGQQVALRQCDDGIGTPRAGDFERLPGDLRRIVHRDGRGRRDLVRAGLVHDRAFCDEVDFEPGGIEDRSATMTQVVVADPFDDDHFPARAHQAGSGARRAAAANRARTTGSHAPL